MTTSSTNNSVFRGFFEKQKLTGPNFIDWYRQLRIVLSIKDKLNYLEQPIPPAPIAHAGQQVAPEILVAHNTWIKGSKEIAGLMLMTMEPEIQRNLEPLHAHEMPKELKTLFAQQAEQELLQTTRYFHSCRQEEGQSVSSYVLKMKGYIDNLERLGNPVTLGLGDHGIIALRTPPYTRQHNGMSKRRNITLLDMVRSMMSQTTLPKSFWDYALETVARILNMVLTKKVEKTPYENSLIDQEASGSLEDLEIIQEEDTHPSLDTSLNHEEEDLEIDEPQSDIVPIRRSTRT
nr:zinc finger, CCHC-type [Tanacetum cinerariifolium]